MLNLAFLCLWIVAPQGEEDHLLGKVPDGMEAEQVFFAEDGKSVVFSARKGDASWRVFYGEKKGPEFRSGWIYAILADGRPVYRGWDGQKNFLVIGDVRSEAYSSVVDVVTSADRRRFAYKADIDYKYFVVADGKAGEIFEKIEDLRMTADGAHLAYLAEKGGKRFVVLDGRPGEAYDAAEGLAFSPDGQIVYAARKGADHFLVNGEKRISVGGEPGGVAFGPQGKLAYVEKDESYNGRVVAGEKRGPKFMSVWDLRYLSDGRLLYCARTSDNEDLILIDHEVAFKPGDMGLGQLVPSPDGKRFAFAVNVGKWDKGYVVVDGKKGEEFNMVENLLWSPDGKRLAYGAMKHTNFENLRRFLVLDGKTGDPFDEVRSSSFSPDGKHFAFVGVRGQKVSIFLDGKQVDGFAWVDDIRFSADGKVLGIGWRKGSEFRWRSVSL